MFGKCSTRFCESNVQFVFYNAKIWNRTMVISWFWFIEEVVFHMVIGDRTAEKMILEFGESRHPVFRVASPLSRGQFKSKGGGMSIHHCADLETVKIVFRTMFSVNQFSFYWAVAEMCDEYEIFSDRSGQPVVVGQSSSSFVLSVIKTQVFLDCEDLANKTNWVNFAWMQDS